jgi:integrating conjugative element membrane protein (TIGR03747 family)
MSSSAPPANSPPVVKEDGFIGKRVKFILDVFVWMLIALAISILIEWIGMTFGWWEQKGSQHAKYMLNTELAWLNRDFSEVLGSPAETSVRFSKFMYELLFVWWDKDIAASILSIKSLGIIGLYIEASITIIQLFFARVAIISFSLPVFVVFALVAIVDGTMSRDIRRFGLDREGGLVFHVAKAGIKPIILTPFILYLASPWSIHPNWIILPFAVALSISLWTVTYKFKKYF